MQWSSHSQHLASKACDHYGAPAGDAEDINPCVGRAVRLMVPSRERQADILVQAVQNHNPHVLIVDEIGTAKVR